MPSLQLTDSTFEREVVQSTKPVLVDFTATWCGPCHAIAPAVDQLADEFAGKAVVAMADMDECAETSVNYGVRSAPTFLIFKGGEVVDQIIGAAGKEKLKAKLAAHL